nr:regulator of chromosome condensation-like isoform X5 [Petromyzon marinus]
MSGKRGQPLTRSAVSMNNGQESSSMTKKAKEETTMPGKRGQPLKRSAVSVNNGQESSSMTKKAKEEATMPGKRGQPPTRSAVSVNNGQESSLMTKKAKEEATMPGKRGQPPKHSAVSVNNGQESSLMTKKAKEETTMLGKRGQPPKRSAVSVNNGQESSSMTKKAKEEATMPGKRGQPPTRSAVSVNNGQESSSMTKKAKVTHPSHRGKPGAVLAIGQGDVGQLGLGPNVMERKRPALVHMPEPVLQAVAGGMHSVCLGKSGKVYTFGCNDEGALGRITVEDVEEAMPGTVMLPELAVQVSAGDSHTAVLTEFGSVYLWGTFRDNNGIIGLLEPMMKCPLPTKLTLDTRIVKVASGNDHLVLLSESRQIYTLGCGEQGQLGRVAEMFANRGGRRGLLRLLVPEQVRVKARRGHSHVEFLDVFCGSYFTFALSTDGSLYGFGLSNYHQLGTAKPDSAFVPNLLTSFENSETWLELCGGQHHSLCLDSGGKVYSLGRADYGRLGLGKGACDVALPTLVPTPSHINSIACGASVSYAVTKDGRAFSWGMGTNCQLGTGEDKDEWSPVQVTGKQLENRHVLTASSGGQHTLLLVTDN